MNQQRIESLIALCVSSGLAELEVADEEGRVCIVMERDAPVLRHSDATPGAKPQGGIPAPTLGTLHLAQEPGAAPFVELGQAVTAGATLCLLEAMKVFIEVKAPRDGRITAIHASAGQQVQAGDPLFDLA
jgi:acetyl-CoA carboxylase biotin carboxyl carrier protein